MADDHEQDRGFTVKDRRRFSDTGEARPDAAEASGTADEGMSRGLGDGRTGSRPSPAGQEALGERPAVPEITLSTFILSLSTQVLLHLGEIPGPAGERPERDMMAAKQVIDILGLLREKTKGNLDENEAALLDNVLYDLRIRYVELSKA
jgi:hypothetical protein